jgi:ubiquinone/menaquinone biosynthesis C-methylase UbiE
MSDTGLGIAAGAVFDRLAPSYDSDFTGSLIGRAQRNVVWKVLLKTFHPKDNILELNCGTGEDALFLARNHISVFACDASHQMISRADQRLNMSAPPHLVTFCHLPTEDIAGLDPAISFDGAFSNFSGLNCIEDLGPVSASLAKLVKPGGHLLFCFSTRFCLVEIIYYLSQGQVNKALRRCKGHTVAHLNDAPPLSVYYPTVRTLRRIFAPHFKLRSRTGVGVAIPPSYLEPWAQRHPYLFRLLCRLETLFSNLPFFRTTGDHVLLRFEKVTP